MMTSCATHSLLNFKYLKDYGTFTLLVQDSEGLLFIPLIYYSHFLYIHSAMLSHAGGLEVKLPNTEKWQKLGHLPGAVFINAGELLSIWTNNLFPALVICLKKHYHYRECHHTHIPRH
jgi:isopenicillin N synthase-like dioxygenase